MAVNRGHDERTEMPTPARLREARQRGQVAHSADLTAAMVLLGAAALLGLFGGHVMVQLVDMTAGMLGRFDAPLTSTEAAAPHAWDVLAGPLLSIGLLGLGVLAVALFAGFVQAGSLFASDPIQPDFGRLSAGRGLQRMFSLRSLVRCLLAAAKVLGVAIVAMGLIRGTIPALLSLGNADASTIAARTGKLLFEMAMKVGFVLLPLAVLDYLFQRWQHRRDLKMTRREVAEEIRRAGVDGASLARRRSKSVEPAGAVHVKNDESEK